MSEIDAIRRSLAARVPDIRIAPDAPRAAVALVLRTDRRPTEILLIERARFGGDPWSGHMAFPGGRLESTDEDARAAAERETLEEVGLPLDGADWIGRLDDLQGRHSGHELSLVISPFVYAVSAPTPVEPNHEVRSAFWFPLAGLLEPERRVAHRIDALPGQAFPGILVGEPGRHVVWGLTYRMLQNFFEWLGHALPSEPVD